MGDIVKQIRDFHRFYNDHFALQDSVGLPDNMSATEARILGELSRQDGLTARMLMKHLQLDAGYLSRILNGLEQQKLIRRERSRRDRRAILLALTPRGSTLAAELEQHAQHHVRQRLDGLDPAAQAALAAALQQVQAQFAPAKRTAPLLIRQMRLGDAGWIIHRHGALIAGEQGWDLRFEALAAQILADFIRHYDAENERSWIAERDGQILGSLFLVRDSTNTARLRLLYIEKAARGMGLATKLIEKSIRFARDKGYRKLCLFTTSENLAARRIYERLGFVLVKEEPFTMFGEGLQGETWEMGL